MSEESASNSQDQSGVNKGQPTNSESKSAALSNDNFQENNGDQSIPEGANGVNETVALDSNSRPPLADITLVAESNNNEAVASSANQEPAVASAMNPQPTIPATLPASKPGKLKSKKLWLGLIALVIIIVLLLIILMPSSSKKVSVSIRHRQPVVKTKTVKTVGNLPSTAANSTSGSSTTTLPAGTDSSSLNNDLNSINSSLNQESSDQGLANNALNDSSQEITVPTN